MFVPVTLAGSQVIVMSLEAVGIAFRQDVSGSHVLALDQCHVIRADEEVAVSVVFDRTPARVGELHDIAHAHIARIWPIAFTVPRVIATAASFGLSVAERRGFRRNPKAVLLGLGRIGSISKRSASGRINAASQMKKGRCYPAPWWSTTGD